MLLELCVASVDDCLAAQRAGADRLELNMALSLGGLTPSQGLIGAARDAVDLPLIVMIRPRPGGFCYGERELEVMARDIEHALEHCADGIAFGVLTERGAVDVARCQALIRRAEGRQIVFHRAFDVVRDRERALEQLVDLGVTRVLTSGGAPTAPQGAAAIRRIIEQAEGRIEVLPGGGVRPDNVAQLVADTGCEQVHASLSTLVADATAAAHTTVHLVGTPPPEGHYRSIDPAAVRQVRRMLDQIEAKP
jgi:copper homeostasis protein